MPVAVQSPTATDTINDLKSRVGSLVLQGSQPLSAYPSVDLTPSIGTEFRAGFQVKDLLNDEAKLKELAKLVSARGVVFFRDQTITPTEQTELIEKLGRASGKPAESGLHIHPLTGTDSEFGDVVSVISSEYAFDNSKFKYPKAKTWADKPNAHKGWHSDITFEHYPSDYATLTIRELPSTGGDTLWASAYEVYDRLSPALQKFLETLTATHVGEGFVRASKYVGVPLRETRGHPENVGQDLVGVHPVIRTNPVTGWKGVFVNRGFTKKINELSEEESDNLLNFLNDVFSDNHDLQVRFRWEENSLAIWDNRSTVHTATKDTDEKRVGTRAVSIGEKPFFDPASKSRREALGITYSPEGSQGN